MSQPEKLESVDGALASVDGALESVGGVEQPTARAAEEQPAPRINKPRRLILLTMFEPSAVRGSDAPCLKDSARKRQAILKIRRKYGCNAARVDDARNLDGFTGVVPGTVATLPRLWGRVVIIIASYQEGGRRRLSAKRQRFMELRERGWSIWAEAKEASVIHEAA